MRNGLALRLPRFIRERSEASRQERAFVMALFALILTTLMSFAGFAVDIGNWYLHATRLQRAADAGALAGVVYMPDNFRQADEVARTIVAQNGGNSADSIAVTAPPANERQLKVQVEQTVPNYFMSLLGVNDVTVNRSAVSEYHPHLPLGAEGSVLGKDPVASKSTGHLYWLSIAGGATEKRMGDRFSAVDCTDSYTDSCAAGDNSEYDAGEQTYVVNIGTSVNGWVGIQAFDPVFAHVGSMCEDATLTVNNRALIDWIADPVERDRPASGRTNERCTGDDSTRTGPPVNTTFQLLYPETSPYGAIPVPSCTMTYPGITGNVYSAMVASGKGSLLETGFRDWSQFCRVFVTQGTPRGDYLLKVTTGALDTGLNRFSLRVGTLSGGDLATYSPSPALKLHARDHIVMTNAGEGNAQSVFPLATIGNGDGNKTVTLEFFDIGDDLDRAGSINASRKTFDLDGIEFDGKALSDCSVQRPNEFTFQPLPSCKISDAGATTYDGERLTIKVRIPKCESASGCPLEAAVRYEGLTRGDKSSDTFTFMGKITGAPVRLTYEIV